MVLMIRIDTNAESPYCKRVYQTNDGCELVSMSSVLLNAGVPVANDNESQDFNQKDFLLL